MNSVNLIIFLWFFHNIDDNLIRLEKPSKIHFENRIAICQSCKSYHVVKNK